MVPSLSVRTRHLSVMKSWTNLTVSRKDPALSRTKDLKKAFLSGGNSTCRAHIRRHYEFYSQRCKEEGIEESERCVPANILRARKSQTQVLTQTKLNMGGTESAPKEFSHKGILRAVTKFVACDDQVDLL